MRKVKTQYYKRKKKQTNKKNKPAEKVFKIPRDVTVRQENDKWCEKGVSALRSWE